MYISLFFLALVAVSASTEDENEEIVFSCYKILREGPPRPHMVPDAEQILSVCPTVKKFLDCEIKEHIYYTSEIQYDGDDEYLESLKSQRSLADDVCDKDSELHKAYAASVDCYRSLVDTVPICVNISKELYNDYREFIPPLAANGTEGMDLNDKEQIQSYIDRYQPRCIEESYQIACVAIEIMEQCGSQAYDVFSEFMRKSGEMKSLCWNEENHKLRSTFLEFLENEKSHKQIDIIAQMFDLRKK